MLRPATPLAVLLFAAFVLLLLSVISTPIIKAIPLGTVGSINYGVFGYCQGDKCSSVSIGYSLPKEPASDFDLSMATRSTLSAILIVHPVAALLTLIMFIMSIVAHLHSPSHSSRYLCGLFIFGIVTFLVCLLAFLVDVLLFVPHLAWGSWLVLVATILVFLSFIVSCAMRRTLVGRKARKKRIAENAEMSGENYYNRQAQQDQSASAAVSSFQPTVPSISGGNGPADTLPTFASYEKKDDRSSDERIPLTSTAVSDRSPSNAPLGRSTSDLSNGRSLTGSTPPSRDQYGNPMNQSLDTYGMRRGPSVERMNPRGRGGPSGGYRGRGGYGPQGRGAYGAGPNGRGPPPGRGGYGPGPGGRGGYGPRGAYGGGMRGGRPAPPPPGYPGAQYDRRAYNQSPGAYGGYGPVRQMSPAPAAPYDSNPSVSSVPNGMSGAGGYEPYRPAQTDELPRAESPPPLPDSGVVGQAVEMDAKTGSPAHPPQGFGQFDNDRNIRDSDTDVAGMLALQEARTSSAEPPQRHLSEGSKYSQDAAYVPARQAWNQGPGRQASALPSPLQLQSHARDVANPSQGPAAASNGAYYEDVDPRFAESPRHQQPPDPSFHYDDAHLAPGQRSPTISERSGFTSVSQRGVNPRWTPGQGYGQQMAPRRPVKRIEPDVNILNSNPDFQLPSRGRAGSAGGPRGPAGGMIPDSAYPGI